MEPEVIARHDREKILKESLRKALKLIGRNPVLIEPKYIAMVVSLFAADDPELVSEFSQYLKKSGVLTFHDEEELEKFFWNWLKRNYPEHFINQNEGATFPGEGSLHRLSNALREELEEKFEKKSKIKIQHAKDQIYKELSKEFAVKIKEIMRNSGQTSVSLNTMDAILEKGGRKALGLLSNHIENAKETTNLVRNDAENIQARVKKLEEEIQYDTIPGLYTVRVFTKKFQEMVYRFKEENVSFSLAFMAADNLDQYVSSSDPMISRKIFLGVAQHILNEIQNYDYNIIPARYDTNLMGILLSQAQLNDALIFTNKVRGITENHNFTTRGGLHLNLTVSAGIAEYSRHDSFWFDDIPGGGKQLSSTIINRAMEMLKKAQAVGGNRVKQEKKINQI